MRVAGSSGYRPSTDGTHCSLSGPRGSTAGISGGSQCRSSGLADGFVAVRVSGAPVSTTGKTKPILAPPSQS
eukprot:8896519-Pyramimonas_sp.AAC.1